MGFLHVLWTKDFETLTISAIARIDLVRYFLGHRDIETALRYVHLSPGHLSEAVNRKSLFETGSEGHGSGAETRHVADKLVRPEGFEPPTPRSVVDSKPIVK